MTISSGHGDVGGPAERRRHVHDCIFPACDEPAATPTGMCDRHRQVAVSGTGSWLEAG